MVNVRNIPVLESGKVPLGVIEADAAAEQKSLRRFFEETEEEEIFEEGEIDLNMVSIIYLSFWFCIFS